MPDITFAPVSEADAKILRGKFPQFVDEIMPVLPPGFVCDAEQKRMRPSWTNGVVVLEIDAEDMDKRIVQGGPRFSVKVCARDESEVLYLTDFVDDMLSIARYASKMQVVGRDLYDRVIQNHASPGRDFLPEAEKQQCIEDEARVQDLDLADEICDVVIKAVRLSVERKPLKIPVNIIMRI